jgi:hypothetical protein
MGAFEDQFPDSSVRWFSWREVSPAMHHGRLGGIALHYFRWNLQRFGLGSQAPACHIISADPDRLVTFVARFGLPEFLLQPPRKNRPDIWHFDAFGRVLDRLAEAYPLPEDLDDL